ncbi:MAG: CDP-alcohol phosphatidyltransferase family protein [Anaerolineae bacterium]
MFANLMTLLRVLVLGVAVVFLYQEAPILHYISAGLVLFAIFTDFLDGLIARRLDQTTLLGSVLDIAADRSVEFVMWVVFAHLGLISVVVPLIVLVRGVFVDALRSMAPAQGLKPFDLMRSDLGRFLVKSPWLRTPYALVKAAAFFFLAVERGLSTAGHSLASTASIVAQILTWIAVGFCLVRGVPVLIEGSRTLAEQDREGESVSEG